MLRPNELFPSPDDCGDRCFVKCFKRLTASRCPQPFISDYLRPEAAKGASQRGDHRHETQGFRLLKSTIEAEQRAQSGFFEAHRSSKKATHCVAFFRIFRTQSRLLRINLRYTRYPMNSPLNKYRATNSQGKLRMRHLIINSLVVVSFGMVGSGCTSYTSTPPINEHFEPKTKETTSSFTYKIDSPWKDSRFGKNAYEVTQKIIPNAQDNSSKLVPPLTPELEIKISEFSSGGACAQDYLTGLSLGLIPSWCTRPNLFRFEFTLNNSHGFCRQKTYAISSMTFSHLTVIPFALLNTENKPLTIYQTALKNFLQEGQCTTR